MELIVENLRIAWHTLRANPLRTLLTALSVSLGAGAIALMVSLSKSGVATISSSIEKVGGAKLIFVLPHQGKGKAKNYDKGITNDDVEEIKQRVPGLEVAAFFTNVKRQAVLGDGKKAEADVAVGSRYREFMSLSMFAGRDVPDDMTHDTSRVTCISFKLAEDLFGKAENAIGKTLVLWGHRYTVIGVTAKAPDMGFRMGGVDRDRAVFVSAPVMLEDEGVPNNGFMVIRTDGTYTHDHTLRLTNAILSQRHQGTDDYELLDFATAMAKFDKIFDALRLMTGLIAAVSLLIAGAGIMNVLLASIRQRLVEVGMRRAIGASQADIRRQFLTEAIFIAGLGGTFGSVAGLFIATGGGLIIGKFVPGWETRVSLEAGVIAVLVASLSGFVFGLQPARRAAKLEIVSCLKGEA